MNQEFFFTASQKLTDWPLLFCKDAIHYLSINSIKKPAPRRVHLPHLLLWGVLEAQGGGFAHKQTEIKKTSGSYQWAGGTKERWKHWWAQRLLPQSHLNSVSLWANLWRAAWPDDRALGCEGAAFPSDSLDDRTAALCHGESGATIAPANYREKLHVMAVVTFFPPRI